MPQTEIQHLPPADDLAVVPKGAKKAANVPPVPPLIIPNSAVALAVEIEKLREQLADAAVTIAARELEVKTVKGEMAKLEDLLLISDRNYQAAINETAEIRGVLKSLAAILIKWDGWVAKEQVEKQDPQVQS